MPGTPQPPAVPPQEGGEPSHPPAPVRERLVRALKYANIPGKTLESAAKRFDVSLTELSKARRRWREAQAFTEEELILAGFVDHPPRDIADLIAWFDEANLEAYTEPQVFRLLARLEAEGWIAPEGDRWRLAKEWP